uniref:cyclin-dependent kinase n=1 Tax=Amphimedon queenslandica TaxID=400682 RepID=A0A1X7TN95_AMPQE
MITYLLLGDEEAFFSKDIPSKGSLKSTVSRSYRSRDKGSYGDSHQDDIDTYRREMKRQAPPTTDEGRQTERRHGDRRRDNEGRHHGRSVEHKSKRKSRKETTNPKRERRTRSRSPIYSTQSRSHSDRREPRSQYSHSDSQSKSHSGAWSSSHRHTHSHKSEYDRGEGGSGGRRDVYRLVRDLESSSSGSDSDEGVVSKEATPTRLKDGTEESKKESPKKTWKDIMYSDSEEEEEGESPLRKSASPRESDQSDSRQGEDDVKDVSATPPLAESVKKEDEPAQPTAESAVEIKVSSATPPGGPVSPSPPPSPHEEVLYLPALMGCRSVECYEWLNRIEEGTYGVVFRARDIRTDEIVALKKLKMEKEREGFPITSLREISTLLKANHENIVNVREIVVGSNMDKIFIVMDYVEHDLKSLMETMKQPFLEGEVKTLLIQLLKAVHHLHDNWIIHRDLKTSNLLLSHKGILKVADFGLAREYGSPLKNYTPIVVTLWYRAPELLLGAKEYSTAIDVWSVGCIFAELLQHKPLFMGKSEIDELNLIFKELGVPNESIWPGFGELPVAKKVQFTQQPLNNLRKRFPMITKNGFVLLNKFFAYDPKRRVTAEDALKHEYFEESPLPVDPSMFPTWPAKSEMTKKSVRPKSPTAPEGGAFFFNQKGKDGEDEKFQLPDSQPGKAGFTLKF